MVNFAAKYSDLESKCQHEWNMANLGRLALVMTIALALSACGGSGTVAPATAPTPQPVPAPAPESAQDPAPESSFDCLTVDEAMAEAILAGATASGMTAVRAGAVRSPDFERVYFIALEFALAGSQNVVGVWASNSLERGGGIILSADSFAKEFSDWGDAATTASPISPADRSIRAARDCIEVAPAY